MSLFSVLRPHPALGEWVSGYWFVQDLEGRHAGAPVRTAATPLAVLSVNLGRPNATGDQLVPRVSLLGVQTRARSWRSWEDTYFVMAMLSPAGLARLFPGAGAASSDALLDLGEAVGDALTSRLAAAVQAAWSRPRIAQCLDEWLLARMEAVAVRAELRRLLRAQLALDGCGSVEQAAAAAGVHRRQLHRWYTQHFGVGPRQMMELQRLQASVRTVQRGGDGADGYADQAHQIRSWRKRLELTPGAYARAAPSTMGARVRELQDAERPVFYL